MRHGYALIGYNMTFYASLGKEIQNGSAVVGNTVLDYSIDDLTVLGLVILVLQNLGRQDTGTSIS
jgi:hypothetical protein